MSNSESGLNLTPNVSYDHPGKIIKDRILPKNLNMTSDEFALKIGASKSFVKNLIDEKIGMTKEFSKTLENYNLGKASAWMKQQKVYNQFVKIKENERKLQNPEDNFVNNDKPKKSTSYSI